MRVSFGGCASPASLLLVAALALTGPAEAADPAPAPPAPPSPTAPAVDPAARIPIGPPAESPAAKMKALGGDRYQIGSILVDKRAHRIVVPGKIAHLGEAPLEYVAVSTRGLKAYESLLEVEASGSEFNLAMILIGADVDLSTHPARQFDRNLPDGQIVEVALRFTVDRHQKTVTALEALLPDAQRRATPASDWVYTGSFSHPSMHGVYAADASGTLIGFVHDPADVIEHRNGLGIGQYGSVRGDPSLLPPIGSPIELLVTLTGRVSNAAAR